MGRFLNELQRRNVHRVAAAYVVAAWLVIQIVETVLPAFGLGEVGFRAVVLALVIGLVPTLVIAWIFEFTPDGLKLDQEVDRSVVRPAAASKRIDRIIMVVLVLSLTYFAFDKFVLEPQRDRVRDQAVAEDAQRSALVEGYGENSIAVLAFVNMSADVEQDYFSDGISEELITLLSKLPELRVISRSSAFSFKGKDVDLPTIARQLDVAHILEGSVRKAGNRVRITAQLVDARTDTHLWSESYDHTLDDVFATQSEIAANVVEQLKLTLLDDGALDVRPTDPDAYALYLQARHMRLQNRPDAYATALNLYRKALAVDPDYPPALEGVAEILVYQGMIGERPVEDASREARVAIDHALEVDPNFGVGVAGLGWMAMLYDRDQQAAARHFERAMRLDHTNLDVIQGVAYLAEALGRLDTAVAFKEYAVSRDPAGPVGHFDLAITYLKVGRLKDAADSARTALELQPGHYGAWHALGLALLDTGQVNAALDAFTQETVEAFRLSGIAFAHHELGDAAASDAALSELIEKHASDAALEIAAVLARRGEQDRAFHWLEQAVANDETGLSNIASHYSFRYLHDDARWQPFLARLGQSDAQLAAIVFDVELPNQRLLDSDSPP